MRRPLFCSVALLLLTACRISTHTGVIFPTDYTVPEDSAITKAVKDAYACISFKPGTKPAYDSIRNYFFSGAQLINFRSDTAQALNIDQFVNFYKQFIEGNHIALFAEEE